MRMEKNLKKRRKKMDNMNEIKEDLQRLVKDHIRLYSLKGVEKSSLFLGVIATFFIVLAFFMLGIVLGSIALANYLNTQLDHAFLGHLIVGAGDIVLAILILMIVQRTRVPLLSSLFVRILVNLFKLGEDEDQ